MTHSQRSRPAGANHEAAKSLAGDFFDHPTTTLKGAALRARRRVGDLQRDAESHCASSIDAEALSSAWSREVA